MKTLLSLLLPLVVISSAYGATSKPKSKVVAPVGASPNFIDNIAHTNSHSFVDDIHMSMELVTEFAQDRDTRDVIGTNNFFEANLSYVLDRNNNFNIANGWTGRFREDQDSQTSYDYVQFEYNRRKLTTVSSHGVDLRLHLRGSYTTNPELRALYGSYGIAESRLFFGRPLFGKFSINRFISYLRLQKYFIKDDAPRARDIGWRVMVSPSYQFWRGFDASFIIRYSGYRLNNDNIDEELEINPSVRYQYGRVALILSAEFRPYDTKNGSFQFVENFASTPTYATILSFFAF